MAAMRSCMIAPRIEARPSSVMTINNINTTMRAAPDCPRRIEKEFIVFIGCCPDGYAAR
ncbi:hypothetical protein D3C71_1785600 [compost metagenome]